MIRSGRKVVTFAVAGVVVTTVLAFAQSRNGSYAPSQLGSLQQPAPPQLTSEPNYEVSAYPVPAPDLAAGEGLEEVRIYCNTCHTPRYITMQPPLPAATWEAEVNKMNKAFGADLPEDISRRIIAYLQTHYSTEKRR
jgi:mono/diheme cytochrome c family protein